ncbi:transposase family protein [Streptomyces noursei]|uniref:DDE Tnp4 domain-containing protein n=1 Tax=Streptomyces noursei TaxID=1971 RepID=A0A2N8PR23_STRNR|nr:transposase family protein [Streptomyces noursei]PNE35762.1 hypothetical protein AOB60_43230 [Streptomyces noursei]PNE36929.1 hypothetical protein AOB60_36850 [Streptomyces noursei]PNE43474.1 hypothetical protein AOB60_00695 [Streptomyces noursei]
MAEILDGPWQSAGGRPRALPLACAVEATVIYLRRNLPEEVIGDMYGVSQATISRTVTALTGPIAAATARHVPTADEAKEYVKDAIVLVDGTLTPVWSWFGHSELRSGKHHTTGFNVQVVTDRLGEVLYVAIPIEGCAHDMRALDESGVKALLQEAGTVVADKGYIGAGYLTPRRKPQNAELNTADLAFNEEISRLRAPVERAIANLKVWRVLHTDYRRPLDTFFETFRAVIGVYFLQQTSA